MGARTGADYIAGLRDAREVWLGGQRIGDVTEHPLLRPVIEATAHLYDMQHQPAHRDLLTFESEVVGERIGRAFQSPRTQADLVVRREAIALWMRESCGFLGRAPDFLNTLILGMKEKSSYFGRQSPDRQAAIEGYYRYIARKDLFLTHVFHEPQNDRAKRRSEQPDPAVPLRVIEQNTKGLIVSGAKIVATAAPYADEVLIWPQVPNWGPGDESYALACAIPVASPGLKVFCRASFTRPGLTADYPISSRFDEIDSVLVFDRVLVPWDRVFLHNDLKLMSGMYAGIRVRELTAHQTNVRLQVKLEFFYALLVRMAESIGVENMPAVMISLGEAATYVEIIRAAVLAGEYSAKIDPENGVLYPDYSSLVVGRLMGPRFYPEFMQKIRRLGASGLMQVPGSMAEFDSPIGGDLERIYRGARISAREKVMLARLAWDICGSELGSRHALYEMYYAGDPDQIMLRMHVENPRKAEQLEHFDRFFKHLGS